MWIYILLDCSQKWHISTRMGWSSQYKISAEENPHQKDVSSDDSMKSPVQVVLYGFPRILQSSITGYLRRHLQAFASSSLLPGSQLSFGAYVSHFCVSPAQSPTLCNALALCLPPSSEVKSRGTVGCYTSAGEQPGYSLLTWQLSMCGITLQNTLPYILRLPPQIMHTPYSGTPCSFMCRWDVSPSEGEGVQSWGC